MESLKRALTSVLIEFSKTLNIYGAVILIFSYHVIFDKDMPCTCKGQSRDCWLYMILPVIFIFVVMLWVDKTFQRGCKLNLANREIKFFGTLMYHILKAAFVGLLWSISLLIDGDWYVCCHNDHPEQPHLGCKDKAKITDEERMITAELKNKSRVFGLPLLFCITLVFALMSPIPWQKWKCPVSCGEEGLSDEIYLEEEENLVTEKLRKAVKDKLTGKPNDGVNADISGGCSDVAEALINRETASTTTSM